MNAQLAAQQTRNSSQAAGKHVLVAYIMKPKAGYDYLATAAHFAAESSTGTNVNVCTTDDFTKSVDALVYYIDPDSEEMKIAYPNLLFDRNITDGRAMMCSFLTLSIGNNQGCSAYGGYAGCVRTQTSLILSEKISLS